MSIDRYELIPSESSLSYEFYSEGPKGLIPKIIRFKRLDIESEVYNLGFGDLDRSTGKINDLSISDNDDRDKILMTVASSVLHFFRTHPNARIAFKGSTTSRTRLYTMQISKHLDQLNQNVLIEGLTQNGWEVFTKDRAYFALLITQKNL
jgi:hypothetical protein